MKIGLGQKVSYQRCFIKVQRDSVTSFIDLPLSGSGIIVGIRYMPVGITRYGYSMEDSHEFKRTGTEKFILVIGSLHKKPRLIRESDLVFTELTTTTATT